MEELATQHPAKKITLSESIMQFQNVMSLIETVTENRDESISEEEALSQALTELMPEITTAVDNIKARVDARINFLEYSAIIETKLKNDVDYLNKKVKVLQNAQKRLKDHTKRLMEELPEIEFAGTTKKFAIQKNGGRVPIQYSVDMQSISNVIDPTDIGKFPEDCIEKLQVFQLKKDVFESRLRAKEIESEAAVVLPVGTHLRIK